MAWLIAFLLSLAIGGFLALLTWVFYEFPELAKYIPEGKKATV